MKARIADIPDALNLYGRYRYLDAFADDIQEFEGDTVAGSYFVVEETPRLKLAFDVDGQWLIAEVFKDTGVVRFSLSDDEPSGVRTLLATGALGAAIGKAADKKEGLLGGLLLGLLVGAVINEKTHPHRVLTLRLDPESGQWDVYDGPLIRWAKRTLASPDPVVID